MLSPHRQSARMSKVTNDCLRNHLPVSEAVHGSSERKCGVILRHFPARLHRRCSHFTTSSDF